MDAGVDARWGMLGGGNLFWTAWEAVNLSVMWHVGRASEDIDHPGNVAKDKSRIAQIQATYQY